MKLFNEEFGKVFKLDQSATFEKNRLNYDMDLNSVVFGYHIGQNVAHHSGLPHGHGLTF